MKKLVSLLMVLMLALGLMPAMAQATVTDEPITLNVLQYALQDQQVDYDTMWFFEELEKATNVHINFTTIGADDWSTKLSLMLASGDYPDVIIHGTIDIEEYGVDQGILLPLDDLLEENMPNYYSRLSLNDANASIPASDGHTYYVGFLIAQNVNHDGNTFINQKWLDNLGLEVPATIEELSDVLVAFRDQDANGNGDATDEIPMSYFTLVSPVSGLYTVFASFGVPIVYATYVSINDDNEVQFIGDYEGFRDACEWLHWCYTEGLLDPDSFTMDGNTWASRINQDQVGYTSYLRKLNTVWSEDAIANFESIVPPSSEYGVQVPRILELPSIGAVLTTANQYVEETLRWLDAQFETHTMMIAANGPIDEGGPIESTMAINEDGKYELIYVPENNGLYQYVPVITGQFFAPGDYYFDIYEMPPHRVERYNQSLAYEEAGVLETYSYNYLTSMLKMDNDTSLEATRLYNEMNTFITESITSFIISGVTDSSWDTFVQTAEGIGKDRYVEIYQEAYADYLAANE